MKKSAAQPILHRCESLSTEPPEHAAQRQLGDGLGCGHSNSAVSAVRDPSCNGDSYGADRYRDQHCFVLASPTEESRRRRDHSGVVGFQGANSFHGAFTVSSGHVQAA